MRCGCWPAEVLYGGISCRPSGLADLVGMAAGNNLGGGAAERPVAWDLRACTRAVASALEGPHPDLAPWGFAGPGSHPD